MRSSIHPYRFTFFLLFLGISSIRVSASLTWLLNLPKLEFLDISSNHIRGGFPFDHPLSSNQSSFVVFPSLRVLSLRNNSFSGRIPSNIGQLMPKLEFLDLSGNFLEGDIPSSVCNLTHLEYLSLSTNLLSGELPYCSWKALEYLDLGRNNLTGKIPAQIGFSPSLKFLKLNNNNLYGEVSALQNLKVLVTLDLGENNFSREMPMWRNGLLSLRILRLRSNLFTGHISTQLCSFTSLQIIDFGLNKLSGSIPPCIGNLSELAKVGGKALRYEYTKAYVTGTYFTRQKDIDAIVVKGIELDYSNNLKYLRSIDLSSNNLSRGIPSKLTRLVGLNILNLSMNHLTGMIPRKIGDLKQLESLDLSRNNLSGTIPQSMSELTYLNHLNFSHNNLSGRILSSNQLQTLNDSSIYEGNPQVCRPPLTKKCLSDEIHTNSSLVANVDEDRDEFDTLWFCISLVAAFILGFWGVCGSLLYSQFWRHAYFQFVSVHCNKDISSAKGTLSGCMICYNTLQFAYKFQCLY